MSRRRLTCLLHRLPTPGVLCSCQKARPCAQCCACQSHHLYAVNPQANAIDSPAPARIFASTFLLATFTMASTLLQNAPVDLGIASRRSGFIMEKDQSSIQQWLSEQQHPKQTKRPSPQTLAPLKAIPYSAADWKKALADVKRHYSNKRYRSCSSRCVEILKNIRERVRNCSANLSHKATPNTINRTTYNPHTLFTYIFTSPAPLRCKSATYM